MNWKNKVGQIVGIFAGVTIGATLVNYLLVSRKHPSTETMTPSSTQPQPQSKGVFDQAVVNMTSKKQWSSSWTNLKSY